MDKVTMDGIAYDLPALEKDCWHRLLNGALQSRDALHNPVVANSNALGINMRTIVLRKTIPQEKKLFFFTDIRSGKWAELKQQNNISWLFYDAKARIQIRIGGIASLHQNDAIADQAWSGNNILSRKNYLSVLLPSAETPLPVSGLSAALEQATITAEQSEAGRKNFGVVITATNWMEWLWLSSDGHRRANFIYQPDHSFKANWMVP